jgi:glutamate synthase (NADPH/NADH) large chain/glutamate synthase (ferredoxin)
MPVPGNLSADRAIYNYIKAVPAGLVEDHVQDRHFDLHVYCGAQIFEAIQSEERFCRSISAATPAGGIAHRRDRGGGREAEIRLHTAAFSDIGAQIDTRQRIYSVRGRKLRYGRGRHRQAAARMRAAAETLKEYAQLINDKASATAFCAVF